MIIHIQKSALFTTDPDIRFSKEHNLPRGVWTELWRRHKILGYDMKDLCDLYEIRTGRKTKNYAMQRWIWRSEVYALTKDLIKDGVQVVNSYYFKEHEEEVIKELLKNLKSSVKKMPKTIV